MKTQSYTTKNLYTARQVVSLLKHLYSLAIFSHIGKFAQPIAIDYKIQGKDALENRASSCLLLVSY